MGWVIFMTIQVTKNEGSTDYREGEGELEVQIFVLSTIEQQGN